MRATRRPLRPPDPTVSLEELAEAHNADLDGLEPPELLAEAWRAARLAERHPDRLVWRGRGEFVSVRAWADERVQRCLALLAAQGAAPQAPEEPRRLRRAEAKPWVR